LLPQDARKALHVVEAQRQQQLAELQPLAPPHPTQLLAEYRQVALDFDLYQVRSE
jgi:hypothetical protein